MRVNIWINDKLLEKIDKYCIENSLSRSKLLSMGAEEMIGIPDKFYGEGGAEADGVVAIGRNTF